MSAEPYKILFLDIDGVVNNSGTRERFKGYIGINPKLAELVKDIVKQTGCEVVLSSTWRLDKDFRKEVRAKVVEFVDVTPSLALHFRGNEINAWLKKHPAVTRYAILDDDSDFHPKQPLFQTSWQIGLTYDIANRVITYLNEGASHA